MPSRFVKNSATAIPEDSYYFNTATGEALEADVVVNPPDINPVTFEVQYESLFENLFKKKKQPEKEQLHLPVANKDVSKMISILAIVVTVGSFGFIFLYSYVNFIRPVVKDLTPPTPQQLAVNEKTVDIDTGLATGEFAEQLLVKSVPKDVTFYAELNDLNSFLDNYVTEDNFDVGIISKAKNLLKQDFAIFYMQLDSKPTWGFVLLPKDIGVVTEVVPSITHPEWTASLVSDVLILSNNTQVFQEISDVKKGVALNLTHNPEYARAKGSLRNDGEAMVIFFDEDSAPKLQHIVTTKNISPKLAAIIKSVLNTNLTELVIRHVPNGGR